MPPRRAAAGRAFRSESKRQLRFPSRDRHTRACGYPVRRGLSIQSLLSLEYRVARPSAQLRTRRVTTTEYATAISRRICARGLHLGLPSSRREGAGKTGCLLHPRSRVRFAQTKLHTSIQGSGDTPAFPAQWLYGLLRALPGERLFCLRRPREASLLLDLTPAPRRPNHTTSPYASGAYVYRAFSVHRISPRVRDDREAPLICRETGGVVRLIWVRTKAEYF